MKTLLAIGSNMGDRKGYLDRAVEELGRRAGEVLAVSDLIETKAYGVTDQADFLNGALLLETELSPGDLLEVIHEIEADLDRVRTIRWGPRTVDIDIIFYGDRIVDEEELHIPHVDCYNRRFVLEPAARIAPDYVDPRTGKRVEELLAELENKE